MPDVTTARIALRMHMGNGHARDPRNSFLHTPFGMLMGRRRRLPSPLLRVEWHALQISFGNMGESLHAAA